MSDSRTQWLWFYRQAQIEAAENRPWWFELGVRRKRAMDPEERDEQFRPVRQR